MEVKGEILSYVSGQRSGMVLLDTKTGQIYGNVGSGKSIYVVLPIPSCRLPRLLQMTDRPGVLLSQRAYKEAR